MRKSRFQAGFINLRHLQTTIREDFCVILDKKPGPYTSRYEEYSKNERMWMEDKDVQSYQVAYRTGTPRIEDKSDQTMYDQTTRRMFSIKKRSDHALVQQVEKKINESNDARYNGYQCLLSVTGQANIDLLRYIFDQSSPTRQDGNFFAHSFLPHFMLYRDAIMVFSPTEEKNIALDSLIAAQTFKPVEERAVQTSSNVRFERFPWAVSTVAREGGKTLKDACAEPDTTTTASDPATDPVAPATNSITPIVDPIAPAAPVTVRTTAGTPIMFGTVVADTIVAASEPSASRSAPRTGLTLVAPPSPRARRLNLMPWARIRRLRHSPQTHQGQIPIVTIIATLATTGRRTSLESKASSVNVAEFTKFFSSSYVLSSLSINLFVDVVRIWYCQLKCTLS